MSIEPSSGFHFGSRSTQSSAPFRIISLDRGSSPRKIRVRIPTAVIDCDLSDGNRSCLPGGRAGAPPG